MEECPSLVFARLLPEGASHLKCQTTLTHGAVWHRREVNEIVPNPAIVTEHAYIKRDCPRCGANCKPEAGLDRIVSGKRRFGVGLMSLIATLREKLRLPIGQIRWYLEVFHGLHISVGAIVDVLRTVAERGAGQVGEVRKEVRSSPVVHADETGWRENGKNGYVWVYATPTEKYFVRGDRSSEMVRAVLGEEFCGVLVSDFYAAYDCYGGYHQQGAKRLPVRAVRRHRTVDRICCGIYKTCSRSTPKTANWGRGRTRWGGSTAQRSGMRSLKHRSASTRHASTSSGSCWRYASRG